MLSSSPKASTSNVQEERRYEKSKFAYSLGTFVGFWEQVMDEFNFQRIEVAFPRERKKRIAVISTLVLTLSCCAMSASSPMSGPAMAPAPESNECFMALTNMSACLTYVITGSNLTQPEKGCCPELAGLVESNPICLCQLLGNSESIGIQIDMNKALKLPSVCEVSTPPVSACSAVGIPVSSPPSMSNMPPSMAPGDSTPSNDAATSPGGPSPSASEEAPANPSQTKNGVSAIQASAFTNFIFGLSTLIVSIFF
ncbi:hypothetical protein VNO78_12425 [Psophocarpus tetragonolobus]|uniref:Bifunctional inhibitor/plant lipid transfer protein/seed storage helical domain-containing protein n=1 Tax=Psophocarpus tetragonolobus TaxID=3891 RepID=A0AAN9XP92_PSOTE